MPEDPTPTTPPAPAPVPTPPVAPAPAAAEAPAPPTPAGPEGQATTRPDGVTDAEWAALGDPGKAAIVRERHAAAEAQRLLAEAQAKVQAFEDANKTQEQRDTEARAALERSSAENAAKALRYEVAAEKGIPLSASSRLVGSSREEIAADADRFIADFPNLLVAAPRTPAPDPGQGPRPPVGSPDAEYDQYAAALKLPTHRK